MTGQGLGREGAGRRGEEGRRAVGRDEIKGSEATGSDEDGGIKTRAKAGRRVGWMGINQHGSWGL